MSSIGETIIIKSGEGQVRSVDILNSKCNVLVGSNK